MTRPSKPSKLPGRAGDPGKPVGGWPTPEPGDVLSYAYLWAREARAGLEEGLKDRPAVVVLAVAGNVAGEQILVAPVTHSAPDRAGDALPVPANVGRDLGLDAERSWIVLTELNRFRWPGPDVRPLAHGDPYHGAIPDWLFVQVRDGIARLARRGKVEITQRTQ
jgi:hypothetical protein